MRIRIGKKQRALLTRLDLVGPFWLEELSRNDQRGARSLHRQGKLKLFNVGPWVEVRPIEPGHE